MIFQRDPITRLDRIGRKLTAYQSQESFSQRDLKAIRRLVTEADRLAEKVQRQLNL